VGSRLGLSDIYMLPDPPNTLYLLSVEDRDKDERVLVLAVWGDFFSITSVRYAGCSLPVLLLALFILFYIFFICFIDEKN
jgi:hypothetical protein